MIPTISQVCTLPARFDDDVRQYASGGCHSIELWLTKLEQYVERHGVDDVRRLLAEHGVSAPVASFQGGLFQRAGPALDVAFQAFHGRLILCKELGISTIIVVADITAAPEAVVVDQVLGRLREISELGQEYAIRVALEFSARATFLNNLQTAASVIDQLRAPNLSLCLDVFHFYIGPSKWEDLELLDTANLGHVQLSDLSSIPREMAADRDRIMPGDGEIQLRQIVQRLNEIGYAGPVSLELLNPQLWQLSGRQISEIAMSAIRRTLRVD